MSEPTPSYVAPGHHAVTPYAIVPDAREAIAFYERAFGAERVSLHVDERDKVRHAEIRIAGSPIMLAEDFVFGGIVAKSPAAAGSSGMHFYLYVPDADALVARAMAAGTREVMAVMDQPYGERSGGVQDPFGHIWWISTYVGERQPTPAGAVSRP
jgi:PhnB protein